MYNRPFEDFLYYATRTPGEEAKLRNDSYGEINPAVIREFKKVLNVQEIEDYYYFSDQSSEGTCMAMNNNLWDFMEELHHRSNADLLKVLQWKWNEVMDKDYFKVLCREEKAWNELEAIADDMKNPKDVYEDFLFYKLTRSGELNLYSYHHEVPKEVEEVFHSIIPFTRFEDEELDDDPTIMQSSFIVSLNRRLYDHLQALNDAIEPSVMNVLQWKWLGTKGAYGIKDYAHYWLDLLVKFEGSNGHFLYYGVSPFEVYGNELKSQWGKIPEKMEKAFRMVFDLDTVELNESIHERNADLWGVIDTYERMVHTDVENLLKKLWDRKINGVNNLAKDEISAWVTMISLARKSKKMQNEATIEEKGEEEVEKEAPKVVKDYYNLSSETAIENARGFLINNKVSLQDVALVSDHKIANWFNHKLDELNCTVLKDSKNQRWIAQPVPDENKFFHHPLDKKVF